MKLMRPAYDVKESSRSSASAANSTIRPAAVRIMAAECMTIEKLKVAEFLLTTVRKVEKEPSNMRV